MSLEKLQFIALVLELFGFSLAIIDTFNKSLSRKIDSIIQLANTRLGTFEITLILEPLDYAEDLSREDADNTEFRRIFFILCWLISFLIILSIFPTGNSESDKFLNAAFHAFLVYIVIRIILIRLLINLLMKAVDFFGQKNFLAGVGFIIALIGILINSFQVFASTYLWEGIILWSLIIIAIYIYLKERK